MFRACCGPQELVITVIAAALTMLTVLYGGALYMVWDKMRSTQAYVILSQFAIMVA
jgi:hypothetical protein